MGVEDQKLFGSSSFYPSAPLQCTVGVVGAYLGHLSSTSNAFRTG